MIQKAFLPSSAAPLREIREWERLERMKKKGEEGEKRREYVEGGWGN